METVFKVTVVYLGIIFGLRILGKREFSQLTTIELVALLMISELVSNTVQGPDYSLTDASIAIATLFALVFLISAFMHSSRRVENIIAGTPTVLVQHGQLIENNMNMERVSSEEIFAEMHKQGLDRLAQVRWAVLESDGEISIVPEQPE